jgi:hypothetical protein
MAAIATITSASEAEFDETEVRIALQARLIEFVRDDAIRTELALPEDDQELLTTVVVIDSLSAVESLCALDEVLSFLVGQGVVKAGGYESIQQALNHMVPRVRAEWNKRRRGKK